MRAICGNVLIFAVKLHNTEVMKLMLRALCALLSLSAMLVSCLSSDDNITTTYSDTAITAVTLGSLNRYTTTKSALSGNDTIVKSTLTGSNYHITIDQLGCRIFNQDTLPVGTDIKHVVLSTLSAKNGGLPFIKSMTGDTLRYYSSTDSLDFSQPRTIRVLSSDGTAFRDYTMTLSVSETAGIVFDWSLVAQRDELAGWADKHLVAFADTVALVDGGTISANSRMMGGTVLIRLDAGGNMQCVRDLESMDDPSAWTALSASEPVSRLIGATGQEMFAIGTDGHLKVCPFGMAEEHSGTDKTAYATGGFTWRDEQLDDDASLLPTSAVAMASWAYAPADSMDYVLMAGNSDADGTNAVLWRKLSRYHNYTEMWGDTEGTWVYMNLDSSNRYALPRMEGLSLAYYNKSVLAVGSNKQMLQSRDQGITWKPVKAYELPADLQGSLLTMAADSQGRLWIATDAGQLWQGKLR